MTPYDELRSKAKRQRNAAIKRARDEYTQTLEDIASLQKRISPPPPVERPRPHRSRTLMDVAVDCLPRDRTFQFDDLFGWMREAEPGRSPSKATVRSCVHRLLRQGVVKRIQRADGRRKAVFAVAALEADREPTLTEWVERITSEADGPLEPDEVLVRMLDAGYQPDREPREVLGSVRRMLQSVDLRNRECPAWRVQEYTRVH